jgi:hypothetical protein
VADISPTWTLAATCRCLTDDLKLDPVDCETPVEDLTSNAVIAALCIDGRRNRRGRSASSIYPAV